YEPSKHPSLSKNELDFISEGGALIHLGRENEIKLKDEAPVNKVTVRMLLSQRMLVGVYLAQYSITTLTWFFISWFPVYLIKERHMTVLGAGFAASLPALCGFMGGVLGGIFSDVLLKKGYTLSVARKVPIIIGMLCSMLMVACNYVDSVGVVIFLMSLSFFGKGLGALGWAVVSDTSPKEAIGLS
ncbi:MFS transporter, partial [Klebsiella pneumoniae]